MGGGVTVMVKLHVVLVPQPLLVAVQVTGVVPIGKKLPEAGLQLTVGVLHPPDAVGVAYETVVPPPPLDCTVMFAGQDIVGDEDPDAGVKATPRNAVKAGAVAMRVLAEPAPVSVILINWLAEVPVVVA